ncbi:hypothetical protein IFM89_039583 [Coptis chinensis]|uniref:AT3G52170-like helix-turn-helix domain-containing protein n=1 Tax=Coptis chinensis TaxID=261450 RepID=A0A835GUC7_9MAGN|nr:hypothetical protein IFM89_039583 [Coptis chinensis]
MRSSCSLRYRALNAGKYPTASTAKKQVGGCFYVVKKIIQELEYNSKRSTPTKVNATPLEKEVPIKERPPFPEAIEVPSSIITADLISSEQSLELVDDSQPIVPSKMEMDVTTSNSFEVKEETINSSVTPISEEYLNPKTIDGLSNRDQLQTNLESKEPSHLFAKKPEDSKEHAAIFYDIDLNNQNVVQEAFKEASDSDDLERDISERHKEENQLPKRSTMWGSLRSFADGIINLWRKK